MLLVHQGDPVHGRLPGGGSGVRQETNQVTRNNGREEKPREMEIKTSKRMKLNLRGRSDQGKASGEPEEQ